SIYQGMMDGIIHVLKNRRKSEDLEREFSKRLGEPGEYLEQDRVYRSEKDVFEAYNQEERDRLFGKPPATVWQALENLKNNKEKTTVLLEGEVFTERIIKSYSLAMLNQWTT